MMKGGTSKNSVVHCAKNDGAKFGMEKKHLLDVFSPLLAGEPSFEAERRQLQMHRFILDRNTDFPRSSWHHVSQKGKEELLFHIMKHARQDGLENCTSRRNRDHSSIVGREKLEERGLEDGERMYDGRENFGQFSVAPPMCPSLCRCGVSKRCCYAKR